MAYYFLTASKDASVYLQQPDQNAGLDEVLEVSKVYYGGVKDVSRALLKLETAGVTWNYREGDSSLRWVNNVVGGNIVFATNTTGSFAGRGGVWHSNLS